MDYRDPDWLAEKLGIDKNTVYRFLPDGTIPAIQLGRKWLVSEKAVMEWLEQETQKQTRARREAAGAAQTLAEPRGTADVALHRRRKRLSVPLPRWRQAHHARIDREGVPRHTQP